MNLNILANESDKTFKFKFTKDTTVVYFYQPNTSVINDSMEYYNFNILITPDQKHIGITEVNNINKTMTIIILNSYRQIVKTCFNIQFGKFYLSNNLRVISVVVRYPLKNCRQAVFYNVDCSINRILDPVSYSFHGLISKSDNFYYLFSNDTTFCGSDSCNTILEVYNPKYKLISRRIFKDGRRYPVGSMQEVKPDTILLIRGRNNPDTFYVDKHCREIKLK